LEHYSEKHWKRIRPKAVLVFAMHQFLGTLGVALIVPWLVAGGFDTLGFFGSHISTKYTNAILTGNPYFPAQIGLGLVVGWRLNRRWRHRSMLWVWVLPLAVVCYAVFTHPLGILFVGRSPNEVGFPEAGIRQALWHWFGWGCRQADRCLDQALFIMPLYVSLAYSIGAALGRSARPSFTHDEHPSGDDCPPRLPAC